jgi:hypothetical protein
LENACFEEGNVGVNPGLFAQLIMCLSEEGTGSDLVRLQPPYASLLTSWVRTTGELAVSLQDDRIELDSDTHRNLVFIAEPARRQAVGDAGLRGLVGRAVLDSLARNRLGVREPDGSTRSPRTAAEFGTIPSLLALRDMLSDGRESSLSTALKQAGGADSCAAWSRETFQERIGWELLLAFRHFYSHKVCDDASSLVRNGLGAAVVVDAVHAAVSVLSEPSGGCFTLAGPLLQMKVRTASRSVGGRARPSE